ncbi:MAG: tetraacyldisaccharide 4'-kinase [bacterium]
MKLKPAFHRFFRRLYFGECTGISCKVARVLLKLLVPVYRLIQFCDGKLKEMRRRKLNRPVVSIGNLSIGGTGKTAFVIRLVGKLRELGYKPAVLKRGQGRREGLLQGKNKNTFEFGDEVALVNKKYPSVPVGVGANRYKKGREIEQKFPDVDLFILDDGFQHRQLFRQLDVVLFATLAEIDADQLPAGPLREPLSALERADFLSLKTDGEQQPEIWKDFCSARVDSPSLIHYYRFSGIWRGEKEATDYYRENSLLLITTLARPRRLVGFLEKEGLEVENCISLPDHSEIDTSLLDEYDLDRLVVTEKELVKLPGDIQSQVGCLRSDLVVEKEEKLLDRLEKIVEGNLEER